jgi:hypothetical protein
MATKKQSRAAKKNIKKAQAKWRGMSKRQHSLAQPEGRRRKKPGTGGAGQFFRIMVRPKEEFVSFRNQDVGKKGHLERLAGRRSSGSWDTVSWLISKRDAHQSGKSLVITTQAVKQAIEKGTRGPITHVKGDIFVSKPRKNIPEKSKPTLAQRRAQSKNIKKARAARRRK